MKNVESIYPSNDFEHVCDNAAEQMECGIIIGYNKDGELTVYGGGLIDGRQPLCKDWLWMVSAFKQKLLNGDYS